MAHRFSNTRETREEARRAVARMNSKDYALSEAITRLDCYRELAEELANAIADTLDEVEKKP
jgi:hypothetical protein